MHLTSLLKAYEVLGSGIIAKGKNQTTKAVLTELAEGGMGAALSQVSVRG